MGPGLSTVYNQSLWVPRASGYRHASNAEQSIWAGGLSSLFWNGDQHGPLKSLLMGMDQCNGWNPCERDGCTGLEMPNGILQGYRLWVTPLELIPKLPALLHPPFVLTSAVYIPNSDGSMSAFLLEPGNNFPPQKLLSVFEKKEQYEIIFSVIYSYLLWSCGDTLVSSCIILLVIISTWSIASPFIILGY